LTYYLCFRNKAIMKLPYERIEKISGFEYHTFRGSMYEYGLKEGSDYKCNITFCEASKGIQLALFHIADMVIINYDTFHDFESEWVRMQ
jgi:hypothetical protein